MKITEAAIVGFSIIGGRCIRLSELEAEINIAAELIDLIAERTARKHQIETYLKNLRSREPLTEFRETDWLAMVDYITVCRKKDIRVTFKDGTEIKA